MQPRLGARMRLGTFFFNPFIEKSAPDVLPFQGNQKNTCIGQKFMLYIVA